jgi:hypothetical protein
MIPLLLHQRLLLRSNSTVDVSRNPECFCHPIYSCAVMLPDKSPLTPAHFSIVARNRPRLLPIQPISAPDLPAQFAKHAKFQPSPFITDGAAVAGTRSIVTLPRVISDHREAFRRRALRQRRELLELLARENPPARDLLVLLSTYNTIYARLLRAAADELEFVSPPGRSPQLDKLEADAAIECATRDVECQQAAERLSAVRRANATTRESLERAQRRLAALNRDCADLHRVIEHGGFAATEQDRRAGTVNGDDVVGPARPPVDQQAYGALWAEQQGLLEAVRALEGRLHEVQMQQMEVMRAKARRGGRW